MKLRKWAVLLKYFAYSFAISGAVFGVHYDNINLIAGMLSFSIACFILYVTFLERELRKNKGDK